MDDWRDKPSLKVMCSACNPRGEVLKVVKYTSWNPPEKHLKNRPSIFTCRHCGARMTFDPDKVPTGGYCVEAELCSPDGSGAAWIAPYDSQPRNLKRVDLPEPPASAEEPPDELHEIRSQAERMRNLVRLEQEMREEFKGDAAFLTQLDRIFGKKKREILGHPQD